MKTAVRVWNFAPYGSVELRLSRGHIRILRGDPKHISLHYALLSGSPKSIAEVQPRFDVRSKNALLIFDVPRRVSVDLDLMVPSPADLRVRISAGDVVVGDVEGNKDLETVAGIHR
jgi:hypothetical protein